MFAVLDDSNEFLLVDPTYDPESFRGIGLPDERTDFLHSDRSTQAEQLWRCDREHVG